MLCFVGTYDISFCAVSFLSTEHVSILFINMTSTLLSKHCWESFQPKLPESTCNESVMAQVDTWGTVQADSSVKVSTQ